MYLQRVLKSTLSPFDEKRADKFTFKSTPWSKNSTFCEMLDCIIKKTSCKNEFV